LKNHRNCPKYACAPQAILLVSLWSKTTRRIFTRQNEAMALPSVVPPLLQLLQVLRAWILLEGVPNADFYLWLGILFLTVSDMTSKNKMIEMFQNKFQASPCFFPRRFCLYNCQPLQNRQQSH